MYTRDAHNNDEAWMLQKLNDAGYDQRAFRSRDFLLAVGDDTEQRLAFGRLRYHKAQDQNIPELTSFLSLETASHEDACELGVDLVETAAQADYDVVYAFPHRNVSVFRDIGFEQVAVDALPDELRERYKSKQEYLDSSLESLIIQPGHVSFDRETADDQQGDHSKPEGETMDEDELDEFKDELDIDDSNTKYSV